MTLFRSGNPVPTLFDLLGHHENAITAGLAYAIAQSPHLLKRILEGVCGIAFDVDENAVIQVQTARRGKGITDIEISLQDQFFCVIEAKNGPWLPTESQLNCYAPIVLSNRAKHRHLVTISHASVEMSEIHFPSRNVQGIPLTHLPWRAIKCMVDRSVCLETHRNKWILNQFSAYLGALLGMENKFSNLVYVVALGSGNPEGWELSWIDIVEKRSRYFYPLVGGGWPDPPNYLGFRYNGRLQSIRYVKSRIVFTHPRQHFPEAPDVEWKPHYCLTLDDPIVPTHEIRAGKRINMSNRCWCMIDALLTSQTVSDALTKTELRKAEAC